MMPKVLSRCVSIYMDIILIKSFPRTFSFSSFFVMKKVIGVGMFECFSEQTCISYYIDKLINKMELCDFE